MWLRYLQASFLILTVEAVPPLISRPASRANDETFYFDKTADDHETSLSSADFEMASRIAKSLDEDYWDSYAQYRTDLFEGDIAMDLNSTTIEVFINGAPSGKDSHFSAIKSRHQLWPNATLPYAISSQYSTYSRAVIAAAIQEFHEDTCIRWVPKRSDDTNYVYIYPDIGCWSLVGRSGGRQALSLGSGCVHKGVIMHELMHALGFFHEQSRPDRDEFVSVMWGNIMPGLQDQFEKYHHGSVAELGVGYDYDSLMHYDAFAFTSNGQPTLVPLDGTRNIGQRHAFREHDLDKMNKLYECPSDPPPAPVVPIPIATSTHRPCVNATTTEPPQATKATTVMPRDIDTCFNMRKDCPKLKEQGWCSRNAKWMEKRCAKSCGVCGIRSAPSCDDLRVDCSELVMKRYCRSEPKFMKTLCAKSCGFCFSPPSSQSLHITTTMSSPHSVMRPTTPSDIGSTPVTPSGTENPTAGTRTPSSSCVDRKHFCTHWKEAGFCKGILRTYMIANCPLSCAICREDD